MSCTVSNTRRTKAAQRHHQSRPAVRIGRSPAISAIAIVCCAVLVFVPGLSGNAAEQTLAGLVVLANAGHVLSASAWTGGIACLIVVSVGALAQRDRIGSLSQAAHGFSSVALIAVVGLALTGVLQGIALVGRVEALVTTGYGRLVMAKAALLCLLALAGALHRGRTLPDLSAAVRAQGAGDAAILALRRLLIAEALLLTVVFALTAVLAGGRPPSQSEEPVRATAAFASGRLTLRASPGRPGANDLQIELRGHGAPMRLTVTARQRRLGLGPIALRARRLRDGRFVVPRAPLDAPGTWEVTVSDDGGARATLRLRLR